MQIRSWNQPVRVKFLAEEDSGVFDKVLTPD